MESERRTAKTAGAPRLSLSNISECVIMENNDDSVESVEEAVSVSMELESGFASLVEDQRKLLELANS